jgi:hypothetical protein
MIRRMLTAMVMTTMRQQPLALLLVLAYLWRVFEDETS